MIEDKERDAAIDNHKDEMINYAANDGAEEKGGDEAGAVNAELVAARIETTVNMFLNVLKQCEDYDKIKAFQKFLDVYQTSEGNIEELTMKF